MGTNRAEGIEAATPRAPGVRGPKRSAFVVSCAVHLLVALGLLWLPARRPPAVDEARPIEIVFYAPEQIERPLPEPKPPAVPPRRTARIRPNLPQPEPTPRAYEPAAQQTSAPLAPAREAVAVPDEARVAVEPRVAAEPRVPVIGEFVAQRPPTQRLPAIPRRDRGTLSTAGFDRTTQRQTATAQPTGAEITVAGFDSAGGPDGRPPRREPRSLTEGAFGSATAIVVPAPARRLPDSDIDTPVAILSKPKPVYTDAARTRRIEGEVVLEVTFVVSGALRVQRVVKGLGHGLDQAAIDAARGIRFEPARKGGRPIDYTATVSVIFRLA